MSRWSNWIAMIVAVFSGTVVHAYEDDDLLCRPGWSPEIYHQQMMEQFDQQRMMQAQYRYAITYGAADEQKSREILKLTRLARKEKEARKRDELIAKRKSENAKQNAVATKTASKMSTPN